MLTWFRICFAMSVVAISFAQGDIAGNGQSRGVSSVHSVADSIQATNWDSLYESIQTGFVRLHPIFQKGCFDCHSDQTRYPWYHRIPVVKGLIDEDIRNARKHVDMSRGFPFGKAHRPADNLARIRDQLAEHEMPPWNYRLMHWSANPSDAERDSVIAWIDESLRMLAAHGQYPFGQPGEAPGSDHAEGKADSSE